MNNRRIVLLNTIFFLIHLFAYAYFFQQNSWNSNSRYGLTLAIVERGTLTIDAYHNSLDWYTGDISAYKGHYYSDKPPGTAFLGALFFWPLYEFSQLTGLALNVLAIKVFISITSIALPCAVAALLVFLVAQKIAGRMDLAFWSSIAVTLGSMFWPFSSTFMSHALTSAFIFASFSLGFQFYGSNKIPDKRSLFFIGLLMGLAFITEYTVAIVIIWALGYLLLKGYQNGSFIKSFFLIGLGSLIAVLPAIVYNLMIFHTPLASGYSHLVNKQFATGMSNGILGIGLPDWKAFIYMTIYPTQGIFWESPVLLLIIPAYLKITAQKLATVQFQK